MEDPNCRVISETILVRPKPQDWCWHGFGSLEGEEDWSPSTPLLWDGFINNWWVVKVFCLCQTECLCDIHFFFFPRSDGAATRLFLGSPQRPWHLTEPSFPHVHTCLRKWRCEHAEPIEKKCDYKTETCSYAIKQLFHPAWDKKKRGRSHPRRCVSHCSAWRRNVSNFPDSEEFFQRCRAQSWPILKRQKWEKKPAQIQLTFLFPATSESSCICAGFLGELWGWPSVQSWRDRTQQS